MNVDDGVPVAFAVVVALLLVGLPFYPGTFSPGYDTNSHIYEHAIEAGPADGVADELELEAGTEPEDITYEYEALSPAARALFDRTLSADPTPYVPAVCHNYVLVCDGYFEEELPSEFVYGAGPQDEFRYSVIEYDGDRYLLRTGSIGYHNSPNFLYGFVWLFLRGAMLVHAALLAGATLVRLSERWAGADGRGYVALVAGGALLAAVGFLTPYLEILGVAGAGTIVAGTGVTVILGYLGGAFRWLLAK